MTTFTDTPSPESSVSHRASGVWHGNAQTTVTAGGYSFLVDEPTEMGGKNEGPNPMEYIIGALNGCVSVVIEAQAGARDLPLDGVHTYAYAAQDLRGLEGKADVQPHFHTLQLNVVVATSERDEDTLTQFARDVEHTCPAINLVRSAAGSEVTVQWQFAEKVVEHDAENALNASLGFENRNQAVDAPEPFFTVTNADT